MAILSYTLIEKIIDVAETYAESEKDRVQRLGATAGAPIAAPRTPPRAAPAANPRVRRGQ